jgi:hypothetical protein
MEENICGGTQSQLLENDEIFFGMLRGAQICDSHDNSQKDISNRMVMAINVIREQIDLLESCLAAIEARKGELV